MAFPFRKPVKRERSWRLSTLCASCAGLASLSRQGIREFELRNRVTYSTHPPGNLPAQSRRDMLHVHVSCCWVAVVGLVQQAAVHLMKRAPGPLEVRVFLRSNLDFLSFL